MSKYIERDAAVKAAIYGADDWDGGFNRSREMYIEKAINNVPTVDAVPAKRGKWLFDEFDGSAQCSECMAVVEADEWENHNWYFCYHCGARMENWNE